MPARRDNAMMLCAMPGSPDSDSRTATNDPLSELRTSRWRTPAWSRFPGRAGLRSWEQARAHPRAVAEVTVLHATLAVLGRRHRWRWAVASWAPGGDTFGHARVTTLVGDGQRADLDQANLPVSATGDGRVLGLLALISDLADGRLARQLGTVTPFGRDADSIADAAFWTWFALRHEPNRAIRILALGAWAVPVATVIAISVGLRLGPRPDRRDPRLIDGWNERCHPFAWTKTADQILPHATSGQRTSFTATSGSGNHPPVSRGHTPTSHQLVPPEVPSSRLSAAG